MKNAIIIIVVAILGVGAYTLLQKTSDSKTAVKTETGVIKQSGEGFVDEKMGSSRYVEYSKAELEKSASGRRVLFFYASWCPTCKPANENFQINSGKIPEDLTLIRVNYNDTDTDQEEEDLAKKYEITYQHTFVQIDSNGNEIAKWNGGQIEELLSNIK